MWSLFKYFDQNNLGYINISDLKEIMIRHGQKVNDESVNVMMKEIDPENKGKITFPEFCKMVTNQE